MPTFTTDDSSQPNFHVESKSVRIYPDSRVIFSRSTVYTAKSGFWFPYIFRATSTIPGLSFSAGFYSPWGAFLLPLAYSFPIRVRAIT